MKITTNLKGQLAASKTEIRALELGYIPCKPLFDTRYDLILDDFKRLQRIQIKYADGKSMNSQGAVVVKLAYEDRTKHVYAYSKEEVDGLVVYIPKIDKLCFFPPEVFVGKKRLYIRLTKSKNGQKKGIIQAEKYFW
jgi:hypothetical protein